jgi:hypothetical protein
MLKKILISLTAVIVATVLVGCQSEEVFTPSTIGQNEVDGTFNVEGMVYTPTGPVVNCKVEVQVNHLGDGFITMKTVYTDGSGHYEALDVYPAGELTRVKFTHPNNPYNHEYSERWETEPNTTYTVDWCFEN